MQHLYHSRLSPIACLEESIHLILRHANASVLDCKRYLALIAFNDFGGDGYRYISNISELDSIGKQID